jgi:NAD(P)-dependent dehydrogenase (short-subunit alcohol dehydrogenase family)
MFELNGYAAIVTGGARGIGRAIAVALADAPAERWGSVDALAEVLQLRAPMLRLPQARQALAMVGIVPKHEDGHEAWSLHAARRLTAATRERILLAVASRTCVAGGPVRIY